MPMLQVNLLSGYSSTLKTRLSKSLTSVLVGITRAKPEAITVWIQEYSPDCYSRGGESRTPGQGASAPETIVREYLTAMENRDLDAARRHLGDGFVMTFPGSGELASLEELVAWSKDRYRFVIKSIDDIDVAFGMEEIIVFARGTLLGEWPDGSEFSGVRFIDRFVMRDECLIRQDVWNDLAITTSSTKTDNRKAQ